MCTMDRGNLDNISSPISFEVVKKFLYNQAVFEIVRVTAKHKNASRDHAHLKKETTKSHVTVFEVSIRRETLG